MKLVVQGSFREWLATVSTSVPPIKLSQARRDRMSKTEEEELAALTDGRKIIDPCRINQFIDPAREVPKSK